MEVSGTFLGLVRSGRFSATRFLGMLPLGWMVEYTLRTGRSSKLLVAKGVRKSHVRIWLHGFVIYNDRFVPDTAIM